jgi:hypothetical protein
VIVIPDYISFVDWTSTLQVDLPNVEIPLANSENEWKTWVLFLIEENESIQIPLPDQFNNWRDWADCFVIYM